MQPQAEAHFRDAYQLDFLSLPHTHCEADLHRSLLNNLGRFLTELGRDLCYIGSEYPVQVGGQDFALDPLFFHRGLNCLVAIELKVSRFEPAHLHFFFPTQTTPSMKHACCASAFPASGVCLRSFRPSVA